MNWGEIQEVEQKHTAPRVARDGAAIRAAMIAIGSIREAMAARAVVLPPGTVTLDDAAINDAASLIYATRPERVGAIVAHADPRVGSRLRQLAAQRGVHLEALQ